MHVLNSPFHFILFLSTSPILFNFPYSFQLPRFLHNYPLFSIQLQAPSPLNYPLLLLSTTLFFSFQQPSPSPFNYPLLLATTLFFSFQLPSPPPFNYPFHFLLITLSFSFQIPPPYPFNFPSFSFQLPPIPLNFPFFFEILLFFSTSLDFLLIPPSPFNLTFGLLLSTSYLAFSFQPPIWPSPFNLPLFLTPPRLCTVQYDV